MIRKRLPVVAALAFFVLSLAFLAASLHGHPLGSSDADRDCGVCKWVRVVGVASLVQTLCLQPVLDEVARVVVPGIVLVAAPAPGRPASRAPPAP